MQAPTRAARSDLRALHPFAARDLLLLSAGALLLVGLTVWAGRWPQLGPLRLLLGLGYTFGAPGYALSVALFPSPANLRPPERAALSIGLSVALLPLLAVLLDALPWGLTALPMALAVALVVWGGAAVAAARRALLGEPQPSVAVGTWRGDWLVLGVAVVVAGMVGYTLFGLPSVNRQLQLSEFFVVSANGQAEGYPRTVRVGEPIAVQVGITNREGQAQRYRIEIRSAEGASGLPPISVAAGETWSAPVNLSLNRSGVEQRIELLLFIDGQPEPYRSLELVFDVL